MGLLHQVPDTGVVKSEMAPRGAFLDRHSALNSGKQLQCEEPGNPGHCCKTDGGGPYPLSSKLSKCKPHTYVSTYSVYKVP